MSLIGRGVDVGQDYRVRAQFYLNGGIGLALIATDGSSTVLDSRNVSGMQYSANDQLNMRLQVTGTSPTTVRAKLWPVGSPGPSAWRVEATDNTSALQEEGTVGIHYLVPNGANNAPVTVSVDNFVTYGPEQPGETTTEYTWSAHGGLPLLLSQDDGTAETQLVYGPGGMPLAEITGTEVAWYHHDQLGSTRLVTDEDGNPLGTYTYDPYGALADSAGNFDPLLDFAGQYTDEETGFQYLRARYYDSETGQFLTRDPIVARTFDPHSYAGNRPITLTDPWGLAPCSDSPPSSVEAHECNVLAAKINDQMSKIRRAISNFKESRRGEKLGDPLNLGHQEAFRNLQRGLRNLIDEFTDSPCSELGFGLPVDAWRLASMPVPAPNQDPTRFERGASWFSKVPFVEIGVAVGAVVLIVIQALSPQGLVNA